MAGLSTSPNSPDATSDEKAISPLKGLTVKCLVASEDGCECGAEIGVRILQSSKPFYSRSFTPIDASFAVFIVYDARLAPIVNSSSV